MNIEVTEHEAMIIVTALGTKYHRLSQRVKWLKTKRITTLVSRKSEQGDNGVDKAISNTQRAIQNLTGKMDELEKVCEKIRSTFNIPYKDGASPENK